MPSRGKTQRVVWEATVNSCWEESLFIVSSLCAEIKTGLVSRSHPRRGAAAAPDIAWNCSSPQDLHSGMIQPTREARTGGQQDSWENSHWTTQPNTPSGKMQRTTTSPTD